MNPLKLRRQDLTPLARGCHDFFIHNIKPTSNQSEVTVERAVLIHCIITSQEVEVEEIIEDTMANIISKLHLSKPPLAFPNIIAHLLEDSGVDYHALDSGDKMHTELKAEKDMTTKMKDLVMGLSLDSRANDMYIHWGLQQCIPNYGPTNLEDIPQIPHKIRDNFIFGKPWHEGLIRPTQPGESSTAPQQQAPPQQAPPEVNAPRRENPDSDDE
ncbi:hypothetical protein PIB30_105302 [Stylosanthes scabra]|uniref:Putative plant transposon protein domain-containing protein n=1 Tax=Stylosanthes scabra TaxID=79078 RepID=A0ABU6XZ98_9FABA|nr:hypothetical protein [Stylosanthes scabra]